MQTIPKTGMDEKIKLGIPGPVLDLMGRQLSQCIRLGYLEDEDNEKYKAYCLGRDHAVALMEMVKRETK